MVAARTQRSPCTRVVPITIGSICLLSKCEGISPRVVLVQSVGSPSAPPVITSLLQGSPESQQGPVVAAVSSTPKTGLRATREGLRETGNAYTAATDGYAPTTANKACPQLRTRLCRWSCRDSNPGPHGFHTNPDHHPHSRWRSPWPYGLSVFAECQLVSSEPSGGLCRLSTTLLLPGCAIWPRLPFRGASAVTAYAA
jgi:hypothetical protein